VQSGPVAVFPTYSLSPSKGGSTAQNGVFRLKLHFNWRKSATKFFVTVSDKVVRHSLAYLFVQIW